ncbi:hypothetical protein [Fontivita pretiosa]|uniref:hypothetical protein n=1 Tax=Fontivita pretiosa TaxID=2989684 RepID=UPI003D17EC31
MAARNRQGWMWWCLICVAAWAGAGDGAAAQDGYARQLAAECDALVADAVRRPYGWAWDIAALPPAGRSATAPRPVSMQPLATPAAGLVLLYAGQLLDEQRYRQAAFEAARGLAAAQTERGQIPRRAVFGSTASGQDEPALLPDRGATRAGLALMLMVIDSSEPKPEALTRPAIRAARWLESQQARDGGWHVAFPPEARPAHAKRLIRLDDPDYRDSTYALLLSAEVTADRMTSHAAEQAVQKLLSLRLGTRHVAAEQPTAEELELIEQIKATTVPTTTSQPADAAAVDPLARYLNAPRQAAGGADQQAVPESDAIKANLWSTAYRPNGAIDQSLEEFPAGADVLASRYAMQTLLGAYLVTGQKQYGLALEAAARSLEQLRPPGEAQWRRAYLLDPTSRPTTESAGVFSPDPLPQGPWVTGTFGLESILRAVQELKVLGRARYSSRLAEHLNVRQHLAAAACGLLDDPLVLDLPLTRDEIPAYLARHEAEMRILSTPAPQDLPGRVRRLWLLLIRARLERMQQT